MRACGELSLEVELGSNPSTCMEIAEREDDAAEASAVKRSREAGEVPFEGRRLLLLFCSGRACLDNEAMRFLAPHELRAVTCASGGVHRRLAAVDYVFARGTCVDAPQPRAPFPHFPGLFRQEVGAACRGGLFRHQLASLQAMRRLEHQSVEFGALRGGILGDAPGLGKTVTILALVLATAGELPRPPEAFWDEAVVDASFRALGRMGMELRREILVGLRGLVTYRDSAPKRSPDWLEANRLLQGATPPFGFETPRALETFVRLGAGRLGGLTPAQRDDMRLDFCHGMALVKCRLDAKRRSKLFSAAGQRALAERKLKPSGGTFVSQGWTPFPLGARVSFTTRL